MKCYVGNPLIGGRWCGRAQRSLTSSTMAAGARGASAGSRSHLSGTPSHLQISIRRRCAQRIRYSRFCGMRVLVLRVRLSICRLDRPELWCSVSALILLQIHLHLKAPIGAPPLLAAHSIVKGAVGCLEVANGSSPGQGIRLQARYARYLTSWQKTHIMH